jgi:Holliday junction DNA helicase RuvA
VIGRLSGRLDYRGTDHVLIDVHGVGYLVYCSERTLAAMPGLGEALSLYTDLLVREDLLQLFGFLSLTEKEWHRLLTSVQGVGAKVSLAILGTLGADGVARAIALGDWASVRAAKGVGPKLAQRIVLDLKDKAPAAMAMAGEAAAPATVGDAAPAVAPAIVSYAASADTLSALANLGYAPGEAAAAVAQAAADLPEADSAALIRAALKLLAPRG